MADTNDNTNNVTAITEKLENTTLSTQTQSSTAIASGNDTQNTNNPSDQTPITNKNNPTEETKVEQTNTVNNNVQQQQQSDTNQQQQVPQQQQPIIQQQVPQQQPQQQQTSENKEPDDDSTNLIINYLPPTMSEGTLATLFSPYGLLERCKIVVDLQTLRSRGYGFVKYDNSVSAERALTALNGYELNGKKIKSGIRETSM
jgi:RNA recognition motif-containing protein